MTASKLSFRRRKNVGTWGGYMRSRFKISALLRSKTHLTVGRSQQNSLALCWQLRNRLHRWADMHRGHEDHHHITKPPKSASPLLKKRLHFVQAPASKTYMNRNTWSEREEMRSFVIFNKLRGELAREWGKRTLNMHFRENNQNNHRAADLNRTAFSDANNFIHHQFVEHTKLIEISSLHSSFSAVAARHLTIKRIYFSTQLSRHIARIQQYFAISCNISWIFMQ